jgi:hypothetical protein
MEKFIKYLCLSLALVMAALPLDAEETLRFKGDYFLYSDDLGYIYGSGNITIKSRNLELRGDVLYMAADRLCGILYGGDQKYDALFFKGIPPKLLQVSLDEQLTLTGEKDLEKSFLEFAKKNPEELKQSSLYFEFREFRIDKNEKIKAKTVIPYMMGLPTVPLKRFTVRRGEWAEKTMLAFKNVNYSGIDGLSLAFFLRLREKFVKGDYDIKLYERGLFKMGEPKRGVLLSGKSQLFLGKKEILDYSALVNSGDQSYNLRLNHRQNFKFFSYSLSQTISGRENQPAFLEFVSEVSVNRLKLIVPRFRFTHDWKKSLSYRVSTPLKLWKPLALNFSWQRKIIDDNYQSDTSDLGASLNFNASFFTLSSNYNFSQNLINAAVRKNFSANIRLKPMSFLMNNITLDISSFYMFSELPSAGQTISRVSPGVNIALQSAGAALPLGFTLVPAFTFSHLWDNREENFTDFSYTVSLRKEIGKFSAAIDYALASRYRAGNFWIEGSNRQNMNINFQLKDLDHYSFLLRFYYNAALALENISFTGQVNLPFDLRFSSFLLYYNREERFQTMEVFIEKTFKKKIKIQGGYSLALKRFFVKFITN